jgi:hypothetical protein
VFQGLETWQHWRWSKGREGSTARACTLHISTNHASIMAAAAVSPPEPSSTAAGGSKDLWAGDLQTARAHGCWQVGEMVSFPHLRGQGTGRRQWEERRAQAESGVVVEAEDDNAKAQTGRLDVEAVPERRPPVACLDLSSPRRCGMTSSTPRMRPAGLGPRQPPMQHRLR